MSQSHTPNPDNESVQNLDEEAEYEMSLSLNVLNHLGLNLYSNIPAVLSEAVANAWDADAEYVSVRIDSDEERIEITDNGIGMNGYDVNNRYLLVGYRRRQDEDRPNRTPKHDRPVMGRKGIGKLSLLSIAETVEIYTTDGTERHAFRMNVDEIKTAIEREDQNGSSGAQYYSPTVLDDFPSGLESGTRIVLKDLKKRVHTTESALRKRLARRFSILGREYDFTISINGKAVDVTDRDYFHKVQFLWTFGNSEYADYCREAKLESHTERPNTTDSGYEVGGWIGTVEKPSDLVENYPGEQTDADDLNKISLMVRGKMAKPDLLEDFNDSRMYTKYLVGEIHADFLDLDSHDDIATSNREDIVKEDPRYQELLSFLRSELNRIANEWDGLRNAQGAEAAREIEAINTWYESLSPDNRKQAKKLFGKINQLTVSDEGERKELFKQGVLAFENLKYEANLDRLDGLTNANERELQFALDDQDDIETSQYHQIAVQRLKIVRELRRRAQQDELNEEQRRYLAEHPWLLNPGWERAVVDEDTTRSIRDHIEAGESPGPEPLLIRSSGESKLIDFVEIDDSTSTLDLVRRIEAQRNLFESVIDDSASVQIICVTNRVLSDMEDRTDRSTMERLLQEQHEVEIRNYAELLGEAEYRYQQFVDRSESRGRVSRLMDEIESDDIFQT